MRTVAKILGGTFLLVILIAGAASMWFWFTPVGVNNYVNKVTIQFALENPELLTQLGMIDNTMLDFHSGKLNDYTKAHDERSRANLRIARDGLNKYGPDGLEGQELLTWKIAAWFFDDLIRQAEFDYLYHGGYRVNQISGVMVNMPSFLTDSHVVKDKWSAGKYISRLNEFGRVLRETKTRVEDDRDHGVVPPDFVIQKSLIGMQAFLEGGVEKNPLVTTFAEKLEKIEGLNPEVRGELLKQAKEAVESQVIPGYQTMIALFNALLAKANHDAGIWRIPKGDAIYTAALKSNTTTDLTPDEIHETGLLEVARIEKEMEAILIAEGLTEGSIAERVKRLMEDPQHLFQNTDEGRKAMLEYLVALNKEVMAKAPDFFITIPPQELEIVRVPEYSQDSSPGGYYNAAALDGSRPGRFYINLKDTADNPRWTLPTLLYHEAAPGHHFQISAAQLIKDVPFLRKVSPFSVYSEGWALYAERIAATDMGMYAKNRLGDLGRLQAEMFRSVRLVVDTGMHHKRWSRERAIDYMLEKTGNTEAEATREIERYVVWPGQATAYKTGQIAILKMRATAEKALGKNFSLKNFHEELLMNGAMPLDILGWMMDNWIAKQGSKAS